MRSLLAIVLVLVLLAGCASNRDRQTRTVERERVVFSPMRIDTPIGPFEVQPTSVVRERTEVEVEKERKSFETPDLAPLVGAVAGGTPWGTIVSLVLGAGAAAFGVKKQVEANTSKRQFGEVVAGVERAKADLPADAWDALTTHLEAEQSHDTKAAVKARVG